MILDNQLKFSEDQAVTATAISTNVIQFNATDIVPYEAAAMVRQLGSGNEIPLMVQVTQNFNTLTSLTVTLETADNAALSTNAVVLATSGAIPLASLVAGYKFPTLGRIFPEGTVKEFLGLRYTVTGTNPTLGRITAALATEVNS